jgi:class 3 adenylate cyclase
MPKETQLVILFADVSGSTKLYETLGDAKARDAIAKCIALMTEATERQGGTLIKTIGDEVMTTFKSADDAAQAAAEMQESITDGLTVDGKPLAIRVGFHFGPALIENNDVFGDAVNVAARMAGQAKAGQIITTSSTVDSLSAVWQASTRQIDLAAVKGKKDEIALFEVIWQREDVTRMSTMAFQRTTGEKKIKMVLEYQGATAEVSEGHQSCVMGRQDGNDLVVKHNLISRLHCKVEYRKGNFVLVDQSINGTYVRTDKGEEAFVRRDAFTLKGSGVLGLGQSLDKSSPDAVRYKIVE